MNKHSYLSELDSNGWFVTSLSDGSTVASLSERVLNIANDIGEIAAGRNGQLVESVIPQTPESAFAGSLSSVYGLNSIPLHTDTAHWPTPCRYLVIGCADEGPLPVPTVLLDSHRITLSDDDVSICRRAPFLVRNGRHSFYGTIMESGREFVRIDQGCMIPLSVQDRIALQVFSAERHEDALYSHEWKSGEVLVIDNWRVLHGRGGRNTAPGRILLRAMVK